MDKLKQYIKEYRDGVRRFFREVWIELKKVTWPSRKETVASTSIVLLTVTLIGIYLGIVDLGLSRLIKIFLD